MNTIDAQTKKNTGKPISLGPVLFQWVGFICMAIAILLNPWMLGKFLADDGRIESPKIAMILFFLSVILCVMAMLLFFRPPVVKIQRQRFFVFVMMAGTITICLVAMEAFARFWVARHKLSFTNITGKIYPLAGLTMPHHFTYDPVTGYALIPNIHDSRQAINTDSNGFRTVGRPIDPGKPSIIFVGDSTVFGWGVADEHTFVYLLGQQNFLEEYNIINMGVPSYSLGHIVQVLKNKVSKFRPKIVVVAILWPWKPFTLYSNPQAWKNIDYEFYHRTIPLRTVYQPHQPLWEIITPQIFWLLKDFWYKAKFHKQVHENLTRPGVRDFDLTRSAEEKLAYDHVQFLKEATQPLIEQGVKVIFYIHPYQYTIFHEQYRLLGQWGRQIIMNHLFALYPAEFLKREYRGDPLFLDGCHLTIRGHQVLAEYFIGILKTKLETGQRTEGHIQ